MKNTVSLVLIGLVAASCHKDPVRSPDKPAAPMEYTDLHDLGLSFQKGAGIDVDHDGIKDVFFASGLVGDPLEKADYRQFYYSTSPYTFSPVDDAEETPAVAKDAAISEGAFPGHHWYNAGVVLAQKVIKDNVPDQWLGNWKNKSHQYIVLRVLREEKLFYGWVELSFDMQEEKIILHRAAVCKEPGREVRAGV